MSKSNEGINLDALEHAVLNEPIAEIPARPSTRLIQSRPSDAELAADYRARIYDLLAGLASIKDDMKKDSFDFNFSWAINGFGQHAPGPIIVFKILP